MSRIHPSAVVDPSAKVAENATVGAFAYLGPNVELAQGVEIAHHVSVTGHTRIGPNSRVFPFAAVGGEPQDKKFGGGVTRLEIGADNVIREHVTLSRGTEAGGGATRIGADNLIMNGVHVGHDCQVGSHCILASFTGLAGHVEIEDYAVLGAYTGVHQFARVGESVMTAANSMVSQDAAPFTLVAGDRARMMGLNSVGLRRREFSPETRKALKRAFQLVFQSKLRLPEAVSSARDELADVPEVERFVRFLEGSTRGFVR